MLEHRLPSAVLRRAILLVLAVVMAVSLAACGDAGEAEVPDEPVEVTSIILASTSSTEDSGLFAELVPAFYDAYPHYRIDVVAVGTGQALEIGRSGDADVLLVHAKDDEERFVADGYGIERRDVMYNDFVIVGPASDPAGIAHIDDAAAALAAIAKSELPFISRGDDSGTHKREVELWQASDVQIAGLWYLSIGQGMGEALTMASEVEAYTLADRGTYLSMQDRLDLVVLVEGDERLFNPYGVIVVADANNPEGARAFADWIVSAAGQAVIETFGVETYGEPLFVPNAQ